MKLLIASGGGGHFAPALAVIEGIPKDWEVLVVGRKYTFEGDSSLSLEYQTAQKLGIPFRALTTGRLQRKVTRHTLFSLLKVPYGFAQALQILQAYKPDVVLSFGGYVAIPVCLAARMLRIPIVVHEQTLSAGLANKIVSKYAKKVCISWKESEKYFPKEKIVLTGNPIRKYPMSTRPHPNPLLKGEGTGGVKVLPVIYVTGGSGGAHAINVLVGACLEKLLEKYIVIHQIGDARKFNDFEQLEKIKASLPSVLQERYFPMKFVEPSQVFEFLNQADLVVARSGINTVTELLFFGKPSLLIPLPYGQRDEQLENAMFVKKAGLGEVADQKTLTHDAMLEMIEQMIAKSDIYKANAKAAKELVDAHAAEKIISVVEEVMKSK